MFNLRIERRLFKFNMDGLFDLKVYISEFLLLGFFMFWCVARTMARFVFRYEFSFLHFFGFKVGFFAQIKNMSVHYWVLHSIMMTPTQEVTVDRVSKAIER